MENIFTEVVWILVSCAIAVIGYFLKKTMDEIKTCEEELKQVQINYIHKNDFFKEMAKIDNKLERITDMMMDWRINK